MKGFAKRLDSLRRQGETKRHFAQRIGISPVQLSRYYAGITPGRKVLERIAKNTGASVDWLLYGEKDSKNPDKAVRLAAKTGKSLSDEDLVGLANSYLDHLSRIDREGREKIKSILKDVVNNPESREKVSLYLGFIKFDSRRKRRREKEN